MCTARVEQHPVGKKYYCEGMQWFKKVWRDMLYCTTYNLTENICDVCWAFCVLKFHIFKTPCVHTEALYKCHQRYPRHVRQYCHATASVCIYVWLDVQHSNQVTYSATRACVLSAAPALYSHSRGCARLCISATACDGASLCAALC